jgi:hypothetical protein
MVGMLKKRKGKIDDLGEKKSNTARRQRLIREGEWVSNVVFLLNIEHNTRS